jgi:hypothetical protein
MSRSQPASKRPRREAQERPTHSKEFPEGYGDFVFKSMDGVIFHFPRFLLSHVSPVFKDMFQLGDGAPKQDMIVLTEDCATLEYFLRLIDPAKETPRLDWERVASALQAAEKYQTNNLFKWFETEVALSLLISDYPVPSDPMLSLSLALRYNLNQTIGLSFREVLKCSIDDLSDGLNVDSRLWKKITILRAKRTQQLIDLINDCPDDPFQHDEECIAGETSGRVIGYWKDWAIKALTEDPSWSTIVTHIFDQHCDCAPLEHVKQKGLAEDLEDEIPDRSQLPF